MTITKEQQQRVEQLLAQMTLEEKIGQLNLESPSIVGGFDVPFSELIEMVTDGRISQAEFGRIMANVSQDFHEDAIRAGHIGAMMSKDPKKINELQRIAVEESRLGIPLLIGFDVIHGLRSVFPIAIAEAGSFHDEMFETTARLAAKESRAHGISWNFAPMIDVARDARWGRVSEGPGEDPYLCSRFAGAKVRGLQNDTSSVENYVAACLKHYVAYGACESGRDYNTTSMSISQLHNVYLPSFKAAVEEGAATVMASFNDLNGVPCTVNRYTLKEVLKDTYGLRGFVVSDANGIKECITHGIAEDDADAGVQALNAGLDMDMGTHIYSRELKAALESGRIDEDTLNDAVRRVLITKMWLGLFENPYVSEEQMKTYENLPKEHKEIALASAKEAIVLLKNEDRTLPLSKAQKISLVGNLADDRSEIIGAWALGWEERDCVSVLDGLKNAGANVKHYPCGGPVGEIDYDEVQKACEEGDVVIAVVGETVSMSGEASSKADIEMPGRQREMLAALLEQTRAQGKKLVTVLMNGRPMAISWEAENLPAILESWHLGIESGNALAAVLFGEVNPSAKLSASFPAKTGMCPVYYNHSSTGRPASRSKFTSKYLDAPFDALYPFGYGLSYTEFEYSDLEIRREGESLRITVNVSNTGEVEGTEIVQLYMQDVTASLVRPVKELKGYRRVKLASKECRSVSMELRLADMGFYDNNGEYVFEPGKFRIYVGGNSKDTLMQDIVIE